MRLNLRQIEAFRYVYQAGSMTVAGGLMGISQPAVSRLIKDLEAEVEFSLFERTKGGLIATSDGAELYREVQRSYHGLDRLGRKAKELRRRRVGDLRVVATVAASFYLLPKVIQRFHQDWPDVKISLHACASPEVLDLVATQQYDIGIAVVPAEASGVKQIKLPVLDTVCILPKDHPLAARDVIYAKDLDGVPLLMISDYSITHQRVLRSLEQAHIDLNIFLESTFSAPICDLIGQGAGVSVLEPLTARAYEGRNTVIRPYSPVIPVDLKVIHSVTRPISDRGSAFVKIVRDQLTLLGGIV